MKLTSRRGRFIRLRNWLLAFCLLTAVLFSSIGKRTVKGIIERPIVHESATVPTNSEPGSLAWRMQAIKSNFRFTSVPFANGEVLAIEEKQLKQLVAEYNQEVATKCRDFQNRFDAAVKVTIQNGGSPPLELGVAADWRDFKHNLILDKIYGQKPNATNALYRGIIGLSGGSDKSSKPNASATPFLFAGANAEGSFQLDLPSGGTWVFFAVADTKNQNINEKCYWFKRAMFFWGKTVKIRATDKVSSKHRDDGDFVEIIFNTKNDFLIQMLRKKYGLLDPHLKDAPF